MMASVIKTDTIFGAWLSTSFKSHPFLFPPALDLVKLIRKPRFSLLRHQRECSNHTGSPALAHFLTATENLLCCSVRFRPGWKVSNQSLRTPGPSVIISPDIKPLFGVVPIPYPWRAAGRILIPFLKR